MRTPIPICNCALVPIQIFTRVGEISSSQSYNTFVQVHRLNKVRALQLNGILQNTIAHFLSIVRLLGTLWPSRSPSLPIFPVQPTHSWTQHTNHTTLDQTDANGTVRIAIQCIARVLRITLQPDVIERYDLRLFQTRFARSDTVSWEANNSFYGEVIAVNW